MSGLSGIAARVTKLVQESERLYYLGETLSTHPIESTRRELMIAYQKWYREAHALMEENEFSGLEEFEKANGGQGNKINYYIHYRGLGFYDPKYEDDFRIPLDIQVALLSSLPNELEARRNVFLKEVSADLSISELEQAQTLLNAGFERASGVVARVALEGFIRTLYRVNIQESSIPKFDQCIIELKNNGVIEERHRKHLADLNGLGNECAHPGSSITKEEIQRLINETKDIIGKA
jgi:hypothetical protein